MQKGYRARRKEKHGMYRFHRGDHKCERRGRREQKKTHPSTVMFEEKAKKPDSRKRKKNATQQSSFFCFRPPRRNATDGATLRSFTIDLLHRPIRLPVGRLTSCPARAPACPVDRRALLPVSYDRRAPALPARAQGRRDGRLALWSGDCTSCAGHRHRRDR